MVFAKKLLLIAMASLLVTLLTACGGSSTANQDDQENPEGSGSSTSQNSSNCSKIGSFECDFSLVPPTDKVIIKKIESTLFVESTCIERDDEVTNMKFKGIHTVSEESATSVYDGKIKNELFSCKSAYSTNILPMIYTTTGIYERPGLDDLITGEYDKFYYDTDAQEEIGFNFTFINDNCPNDTQGWNNLLKCSGSVSINSSLTDSFGVIHQVKTTKKFNRL